MAGTNDAIAVHELRRDAGRARSRDSRGSSSSRRSGAVATGGEEAVIKPPSPRTVALAGCGRCRCGDVVESWPPVALIQAALNLDDILMSRPLPVHRHGSPKIDAILMTARPECRSHEPHSLHFVAHLLGPWAACQPHAPSMGRQRDGRARRRVWP